MRKNLLITGAAGRIGSALSEHIRTRAGCDYHLLLSDQSKLSTPNSIKLDITDQAACREAFKGVDTIVHLAGIAKPDASFESLLPTNIIGTYNVFHEASEAGVRRVVFASSAQVVEGYPLDIQIKPNMPVRPKNMYGVSKAYGEALASYFAYQQGLEVIVIRIGAFEYPEEWQQMSSRDLSAWSSPRDLCEMLVQCIEVDMRGDLFLIAHGISNNRFKRLELSQTCERLGVTPQDDAFEIWNVGLSDLSIRA